MEQAKTATAETAQQEKRKFSTLDLCYMAIFAAIIAVMAQISVPLPGQVPFTLQTLAVPLAGIVIGSKRGTLATVVYVLLGAVGVPVFAGFTGGIGIVLGVTGGFIVSFPLMALAAGLGIESRHPRILVWVGLVVGALLNYAVGTVWFMVAAESSLVTALTYCVIPFIPTAIIKIVLAGFFGQALRFALNKAGLLR